MHTRKSKLLTLFVMTVFVVAVLVMLIMRVHATSDTTPMELVDLSVSETAIDVSEGEVEVDLSGEVFEDLSGFKSIEFFYLSPSGNQIIEGDASSDPEFIEETIVFPQYIEPGVWRPTFILEDEATNSITLGPDDLVTEGFSVDITVTSSPADTTAPSVTNLTVGSPSIDTGSGSAALLVTVFATDDNVGIDLTRSQVSFVSPGGGQRVSRSLSLVSGTEHTASVVFPQFSEVGTWTMELTLADILTNTELYDATDLAALSLPTSVDVTGSSDTSPVSVDGLDFTVADPVLTGDVGSAQVTISANFSDNASGFASAIMTYSSQSSTQIAESSSFFDGSAHQFTVTFPPFVATGIWLPELITADLAGNTETLTHTDLVNLGFDLTIDIGANESATVGSGGSVTTDTGGDGATPAAPFEAEVVTPVAGEVSITQLGLTEPVSANDFLIYDQQYDIDAPTASVADPLVLTFTIDAGSLEGQTAATVQIFRNGVQVADCLGSTIADPDPCITERTTLGDGDVQLVVNTSEASVWVLGYEASTEPPYTFERFKRPLRKSPPRINRDIGAGRAVPVRFILNGESERLDILPPHIASSQQIDCTTRVPIGDPSPIVHTNSGDLRVRRNGTYTFTWKTLRAWKSTCRQLILEFDNGETVNTYLEFRPRWYWWWQ